MSEDWKISIDYREMNKDFVYVKVYINNLGSGFRRKEGASGGMKRNYGRKIRKRVGGGHSRQNNWKEETRWKGG